MKYNLLISMPSNQEYGYFLLGLLIVISVIIAYIFYLKTLQSLLQEVSLRNQRMQPSNVWLLLIPFFGLVWHFIMVGKIADSIKEEFVSRHLTLKEDRPGYNLGLTMCVLNCLFFIPLIGSIARLGGLICWILYWVKINNYKTVLLTNNENKNDIFG